MRKALLLVFLAAAVGGGCATTKTIPGTTVTDSEVNRELLRVIELYKSRLIERNVEGLLVLASDRYFEDSGTPSAMDDYDYSGLKTVLANRLSRLKSLRYDIQYRSISLEGDRAQVEVFMSGAFELMAESGDRYRRVSDYHRFVLERSKGDKWKFVSGM